MRSAFKEERERREARIAAAQARLQTHRRLHAQRRAAALLGAGWERLPGVLLERWLDPHSRQAWIGRVVAEAGGALRGQWRIAHPADWPEGERDALRSAVASEGTAPQLEADRTIAAGLRIAAGGNVIDGTIAGLLADRAEIGARLLWHMEDA
jgi:hypothetical protein